MSYKIPEMKFITCSLCEKNVEYTKLMQIANDEFQNCIDIRIDNKEFYCKDCMQLVKDIGNMYKK